MSRRNFLVTLCGALFVAGVIFGGCSVPEDEEKVIDPSLVGKWEVKTLTVNGTTINLPTATLSAGYEFTKNTYKVYSNEEVTQDLSEVYTKGNRVHQSEILYLNMTFEASDNVLTVVNLTNNATMVCDKVSKFSWEE